MASKSEQFRADGNKIYKSCYLHPPTVVYLSRLSNAIQYYESAKEAATNPEEKASALKNIGVAYYKQTDKRTDSYERLVDYQSALKALTEAYKIGEKSKPKEWIDSLKNEIHLIADSCLLTCENLPNFDDRFNNSFRLSKIFSEMLSPIKVKFLLSMVRGNLSWSHSLLKKKNFSLLLRKLYESIQYAEGGIFLCKQIKHDEIVDINKALDELLDMKDAYSFMTNQAEALKEMHLGEGLIKKAINSDEEISMDLIWNALDKYKHASILCRERDVETEAEINSKIGCVYYDVLKMPKKSKNYLQVSITMALSLGRNMNDIPWYDQANNFLRNIQEEEMKKDDADYAKKRQLFREMREKELEEIKKTREEKSAQVFLKFILEKYPSKIQTIVLTEQMLETSNMKRTLLNVIRLYHPDKQPQTDRIWCFMAEEISKYLNSIYEAYK